VELYLKNKPILKLDWATFESAKYACENWHYSKCMPVGKLVKIGVWENDIFKGVIIYGLGASATLNRQFNLKQHEVCELTRVALDKHECQVSQMIAISFKFLIKYCTNIQVIVSFADQDKGHHGGIYQATNWIYTGESAKVTEYFYNGKYHHATAVFKKFKPEYIKTLPQRRKPPKYRYVMPLNEKIRKFVLTSTLPYPKRGGSIDSDVKGFQSLEGGANPTPPLHFKA
jgi:hypothetical protein